MGNGPFQRPGPNTNPFLLSSPHTAVCSPNPISLIYHTRTAPINSLENSSECIGLASVSSWFSFGERKGSSRGIMNLLRSTFPAEPVPPWLVLEHPLPRAGTAQPTRGQALHPRTPGAAKGNQEMCQVQQVSINTLPLNMNYCSWVCLSLQGPGGSPTHHLLGPLCSFPRIN